MPSALLPSIVYSPLEAIIVLKSAAAFGNVPTSSIQTLAQLLNRRFNSNPIDQCQ